MSKTVFALEKSQYNNSEIILISIFPDSPLHSQDTIFKNKQQFGELGHVMTPPTRWRKIDILFIIDANLQIPHAH